MFNVWGKIKELINRPYIVEQGETEAGKYTQWSNGLMICSGKRERTITMNSTSGQLFSGIITGVQFPKVFTEIPDVVVNSAGTQDYHYASAYGMIVEKTQIKTITFVRTNSSASANVKFNYIAIGKWK